MGWREIKEGKGGINGNERRHYLLKESRKGWGLIVKLQYNTVTYKNYF